MPKRKKAKADSLYGNSYWTPQLLYIEAIYYVSRKEDSTAIDVLKNITSLYQSSPMAERAQTMIDVLGRRKEIEAYLTALQITRDTTDEYARVINLNPVETLEKPKVEMKRDSIVSKPVVKQTQLPVDTLKTIAPAPKSFSFNANEPQYVAILLDKVDRVYASEARNAFNRYNLGNYYNQRINVTSVKLDDRYDLVLMGPFTDAVAAMNYVDKTKPITPSRILPWLTADRFYLHNN